jgi:hypothetical protein
MLADVLTGESPVGAALPGSAVAISAVGTGDQPDESADGKVLVGCCAGVPVLRFDPPGGRAQSGKTPSLPGLDGIPAKEPALWVLPGDRARAGHRLATS